MIRTPGLPGKETIDIRIRENGSNRQVIRVMKMSSGTALLVWELVSSTFLDASGNVFYDASGVPFQGKQGLL